MSAVPSRNASAGRIGSRARAGIAAQLLAAGVAGPAGNRQAAAAPQTVCQDPRCREARPLDHLSVTIDGLKASLSAIRQDLETRRGETQQPAQAIEELCATPLAVAHAARDAAMSALEQIRVRFESERATAQATVAATGDELSVVRERLAVAKAEAAQLRDERARLKTRSDELGALLVGELVGRGGVFRRVRGRAPMRDQQLARPDVGRRHGWSGKQERGDQEQARQQDAHAARRLSGLLTIDD